MKIIKIGASDVSLAPTLEVSPRFELGVRELQSHALPLGYDTVWSGLRGSNSLPPPWQGGALPNELNPHWSGDPDRARTDDL